MISDHKLNRMAGRRYHWCGICWRLVRYRTIFREQGSGADGPIIVPIAGFWYHVGTPLPQAAQADTRWTTP